ncbi:phosphoserine phosphatase SerB [Fundidesulfovibrio terrae]|uniref:phosphoserine phosphatase SerB n=1 Tax=Fundidesulfovibrio terrae TaxID=2922866 RepID=UPI001FAFAFD0|nr:phosphoserine phosphatase SerB [Fundidesulfovibrio terrae]
MKDLMLVHISGTDRPGIASTVSGLLAEYGVDILDMGQAVIHDALSLGLLVRIPEGGESAAVVKDLLYAAHEMGISCKFTPVSPAGYTSWVEAAGKPRWIVTLLGRTISAAQVAAVTQVVSSNGLNIQSVNRLTGRPPLNDSDTLRPACIEFSVRGNPGDVKAMRKSFLAIAAEMGVDIALQEDNAFRRNRRLVAFDMDSTLIRVEVIDELAKAWGVGEQVSAITESAMRGELDFRQSLAKRLSLLKGFPVEMLEKVAEHIPLNDGAEKLVRNLKRFGYKTAVISGGFTFFGEKLKARLGIDYVHANKLKIEDGKLTGEVDGEIVDAQRKAELLKSIAQSENISLKQTIAVGDGANDLPMLNLAGLGIAFRAKPVVKEGAGHAISTLGLDAVLYLLGFRDRDIE